MKQDIFVWCRKFKKIFLLTVAVSKENEKDKFYGIEFNSFFRKDRTITNFGLFLDDLEDYHFFDISAHQIKDLPLNDIVFPRTKTTGNIIPRNIYISEQEKWIRPLLVDRSYRDVVKVTFKYKDELKFATEYFPRNESWR